MTERKNVALIIGSNSNFEPLPFRYFVLALNLHQTFYEFYFPDVEGFTATSTNATALFDQFERVFKPVPANYFVIIISTPLEGNLFCNKR